MYNFSSVSQMDFELQGGQKWPEIVCVNSIQCEYGQFSNSVDIDNRNFNIKLYNEEKRTDENKQTQDEAYFIIAYVENF